MAFGINASSMPHPAVEQEYATGGRLDLNGHLLGGGLTWYSAGQRWLPGTTHVPPRAGVKSSSSQKRLQCAGKSTVAGTLPWSRCSCWGSVVLPWKMPPLMLDMRKYLPSMDPTSSSTSDRSTRSRISLPLFCMFETSCFGPVAFSGASSPSARSAAAWRPSLVRRASTSAGLRTSVSRHSPYSDMSRFACSMSAV